MANITYRGINWIFVPTTLLTASDSCIGSKTSLNYKKYKNLLGTFYPPNEIHICSKFFESLSDKDYKSGLGEVVKFNIMKGRQKKMILSGIKKPTAYLRKMAIDGYVIRLDLSELTKILRLARINSNKGLI